MKKITKLLSITLLICIFSSVISFAEAKVVNQGNTQLKEMALTFDDGYSVEKIRSIVSKLNKYGVKGTFFFVGSFIASHKEIIPELEADGHLVVSHSFTHADFTKLTDKGIVGEIENTKIAYTKATDKNILPYFRPPYGAYNDRVLKTLGGKHDLYVVMWTIDTLDWKGISASEISNTVLSQAGNGKIVLMHTTKHVNTDEALDQIIPELQNQGYDLVRIDEMLSKLPAEQQISGIENNLPSQEQNKSTTPNNEKQPDVTKDQQKTTPVDPKSNNKEMQKKKNYLYRLLYNLQKL